MALAEVKDRDPVKDPDVLDSPDAGSLAVRSGVLRVVGYGVGIIFTAGSAALLFRHLGRVQGGEYVLILSIVALTCGVTDAGLSTIGIRELSVRKPSERTVLLRNLLSMRILFSSVGIAAACAYGVLTGLSPVLLVGLVVAGIAVLLQNVQNALATSLTAELRLGWVTIAELARQAATAGGIVVLVLLNASLGLFFLNVAFAGLVGLGLTACVLRDRVGLIPGFHRSLWRDTLRATLPFALAVAVAVVYFRLAVLLV